MKTRGESEESPNTIPAYSRAARIYVVKSSDAGNHFRMQDGRVYNIAKDGSVRRAHQATSKTERNRAKREARERELTRG